MSNNKYSIMHRDVRRMPVDTWNHRFMTEYFLSTDPQSKYAIILFGPDPRYCKSSIYFPLIEYLFRTARQANISVMRIDLQGSPDYTETETMTQYTMQANVAIELFKNMMGYSRILAVGISAGAYLAMQMVLRRYELVGGIMISPHFQHYRFDELIMNYSTKLHIIHRPQDKYVNASVLDLFIRALQKHDIKCGVTSINASDDNYVSSEDKVWEVIQNFLSDIAPINIMAPSNSSDDAEPKRKRKRSTKENNE